MDLRKKQILEKSNALYVISFAILCFYIILTLLGLNTRLSGLRLAVQITALIIEIICSRLFRRNELGLHICLYILLVVYVISLLTTPNIYMYAFMYPIVLMVISFMDSKMAIKGSIAAITTNVVYSGIVIGVYDSSKGVEVITQTIMCIITCIVAIRLVRLLEKHNTEDITNISSAAEESQKTTEGVIKMSENIAEQITQADDTISTLCKNVDSSNQAVADIADGTKATADSIGQQTIMTSNIQEELESMQHRTENMKDISDRTTKNVMDGTTLLDNLQKQALHTAEINKVSKNTTSQLSERITEVEEIIGTILQISSHTNLLALNASIEAARAGEAGKGFAVVAEEIRNLSEETKSSTDQISQIINKFIQEVNLASDNMQQAMDSSAKQNEMIQSTSDKFHDIQLDIENLIDNITTITQLVGKIVDSNTAIMDSISNLSATSEEVAASSENSIQLTENTAMCAEQMKTILDNILKLSKEMEELVSNNE